MRPQKADPVQPGLPTWAGSRLPTSCLGLGLLLTALRQELGFWPHCQTLQLLPPRPPEAPGAGSWEPGTRPALLFVERDFCPKLLPAYSAFCQGGLMRRGLTAPSMACGEPRPKIPLPTPHQGPSHLYGLDSPAFLKTCTHLMLGRILWGRGHHSQLTSRHRRATASSTLVRGLRAGWGLSSIDPGATHDGGF